MTLAPLPRAAALLSVALLLGGCASHDGSHDPTAGPDNPANPNAPAAPPPQAFTMGRLAGPPGRAVPASAPTSQPAGAYVCPMHPEVTSNTPGTCPKCKMKLEPRKAGAPTTAASPAPSAGYEGHDHGGHP